MPSTDELIRRVHEYRAKHGNEWGGPPYSAQELIYAHNYERVKNMSPEYELREVIEHGLGLFSVHRQTGEVCECKMVWNEDGTVLSCPVCGVDGT